MPSLGVLEKYTESLENSKKIDDTSYVTLTDLIYWRWQLDGIYNISHVTIIIIITWKRDELIFADFSLFFGELGKCSLYKRLIERTLSDVSQIGEVKTHK